MQVLVVDDQAINRFQLVNLLEANGYSCIEAASGKQALEIIESNTHDIAIILMDVIMPGMDGIETTRCIKSKLGQTHLPIVFITASQEPNLLESCFAAGGDDFISRPVTPQALLSRLKAHARVYSLHKVVEQRNKTLSRHNRNIAAEHQVVEHVFNNVIKPRMLECQSIGVYLSPMSMFNGDLYLAYRTEIGTTYLFVGDFTGHGLSAAIGCMPVAEIFYAMAAKYATTGDIAAEINRKLLKILPSSIFCCAAIFELSPTMNRVKVWSGGMHDIFIIPPEESKRDAISSQHMPLGILTDQEFDRGVQEKELAEQVRLFVYSDGLIEAQNIQGELYGEDRLAKIINCPQESYVHSVLADLEAFKVGCEQKDDITLVEVNTALAPVTIHNEGGSVSGDNTDNRYLPSVINPSLSIQLGTEPKQLQLRFVPQKIIKAPGIEGLDEYIIGFEQGQDLPIVHLYRLIKLLLHSIHLAEQNTDTNNEIKLADYYHEICMHMERKEDVLSAFVAADIFLMGTELQHVDELNGGYRWKFPPMTHLTDSTTAHWRKTVVHSHGRVLRVEVSQW